MALSSRQVIGVGRIWADGKLLRGAYGDFKTRTGFRLHPGGEDQPPDPLIAAAEGEGLTPAHRGIAYAVFENLELGDFGNRIPSLTFEVFADAEPRSSGAILAELAGGTIVAGDATPALDGFSAYGASLRPVAESLAGVSGAWFRASGAALELASGAGSGVAIEDRGLGSAQRPGGRGRRSVAAADSAPRTLSLSHYDPARDYQTGVQRAARPGAGRHEARIELPAAVSAGQAKTIAEAALARLDLERERRSVSVGWEWLTLRPGDRVSIAGAPGSWRIDRWQLQHMVLTLDCVRIAGAPLAAAASSGRALPAPDVALGETVIHAFELPPLDDTLAAAPRLAVAAAGSAPGWRSAALLISSDGGSHWREAGATRPPAVLGHVVSAPGRAPATMEDRINAIEVELAHAGMMLADADAQALDRGANLAMVGDELLQFASAEPLSPTRWRLTRLWRGRRGTEASAGTQGEGDRFVLLDADSLAITELPSSVLGTSVSLLAQGAADAEAAEAEAAIEGISVAPPAPVHLTARLGAGGLTVLSWVRRSRAGWRWVDGVDAALAEEGERDRVTVVAPGTRRSAEVTAPIFELGADERATALTIEVRQIGSHALSRPAILELPALEDM